MAEEDRIDVSCWRGDLVLRTVVMYAGGCLYVGMEEVTIAELLSEKYGSGMFAVRRSQSSYVGGFDGET